MLPAVVCGREIGEEVAAGGREQGAREMALRLLCHRARTCSHKERGKGGRGTGRKEEMEGPPTSAEGGEQSLD